MNDLNLLMLKFVGELLYGSFSMTACGLDVWELSPYVDTYTVASAVNEGLPVPLPRYRIYAVAATKTK